MNSILKFLLSKKETREDIRDFCNSKKKYCQDNKEVVCERILRVSGYETKNFYPNSNTRFCKLYSEISDISKNVRMTPELLKTISKRGTSELQAFVVFNGHFLERREPSMVQRKFSFADSIRDLRTI